MSLGCHMAACPSEFGHIWPVWKSGLFRPFTKYYPLGKHASIYTIQKCNRIHCNETIARITVTNIVKISLICHKQSTVIYTYLCLHFGRISLHMSVSTHAQCLKLAIPRQVTVTCCSVSKLWCVTN